MKANIQEQHHQASKSTEMVKWIGVVILLVVAVVGNSYLEAKGHGAVVRALLALVLIAAALVVAALTEKGMQGINFAKASRMEMRKVIWPTRQETVQTGMIVIAALAVMSLILWGVDGIFVRLISFISGV